MFLSLHWRQHLELEHGQHHKQQSTFMWIIDFFSTLDWYGDCEEIPNRLWKNS